MPSDLGTALLGVNPPEACTDFSCETSRGGPVTAICTPSSGGSKVKEGVSHHENAHKANLYSFIQCQCFLAANYEWVRPSGQGRRASPHQSGAKMERCLRRSTQHTSKSAVVSKMQDTRTHVSISAKCNLGLKVSFVLHFLPA